MSLKTRCPACDTVFKIVPDQLKVSKGWVRCGRCAEVFDAISHAAALDETTQQQQTSPPKPVTNSTNTSAKATDAATFTTAKIVTKDVAFTPKNIAAQAVNTPENDDLLLKKQVETDLSFVKIAKNKAFWQQKTIATSLRAACLGLVGLLFLQVGFSQRNHLVAANPALKPSFESFCQTLGCKIEPFKNIDAFKIDSSSFQKATLPATTVVASTDAAAAQADAYILKISLKNNIDLPLAFPSIELTLTDASDKPVLRRVLSTQDFASNGGIKSNTLAANGDWSGEMTLAVTANRALPPVSGYRVLLFYP